MLKKMVALVLCFALTVGAALSVVRAESLVFTENRTGKYQGYNFELWKDNGDTAMSLNGGGTFSCNWGNIGNALFRTGIKYNPEVGMNNLGELSLDYGCTYQPRGNSYLCVYGWMKLDLIEYYIIENWNSFKPPGGGGRHKGTVEIDGGVYDIYESDRINQPSIIGNTTFKQYWSVRQERRTSGTVSISKHFEAWEECGLKLGKVMNEVALCIEGFRSQGIADVYHNVMSVDGVPVSTEGPMTMPSAVPSFVPPALPTPKPTASPTVVPTPVPTATPSATSVVPPTPTVVPTVAPSASPSQSPGVREYQATFQYPEGDQTVSTVGGKVARPKNPKRAGYTFQGWYTDASGENEFNFDEGVQGNVTIYPKFKAKKITLTFDAGKKGFGKKRSKKVVNTFGKPMKLASNPKKAGYKFKGWYTKKKGGVKVGKKTKVPVKNTTYYARWKK